jgi:hypothetical protein
MLLNSPMEEFYITPLSSIFSLPLGLFFLSILSLSFIYIKTFSRVKNTADLIYLWFIKIKFTGFIILNFIISYSLLLLWCANLFCFYTFYFFDHLIPVTGCTGKVHTNLLDRYILNTNFIVNNILKPNGFGWVKPEEALPFMDGLIQNLELNDKNSFHVPAKTPSELFKKPKFPAAYADRLTIAFCPETKTLSTSWFVEDKNNCHYSRLTDLIYKLHTERYHYFVVDHLHEEAYKSALDFYNQHVNVEPIIPRGEIKIETLLTESSLDDNNGIVELPLAANMGKPTHLNQSMELDNTILSEDLAKSQYYLDVLLASIDKIESHPDVNFQDIENHQKEEAAKGILQPSTEENKKFNDSRKHAIKSLEWVK